MASYSGTPLAAKLGITEGTTMALYAAPDGFADLLGPLPDGAEVVRDDGPVALVLAFGTEAADLDRRFREAIERISPHGAIWVAWPKRASGVPTDITEDRCRQLFPPTGMVDVKVCAIDGTWSGLKFVWRRERRRGLSRPPGSS